jgi:hypothetical protein
MLSRVAVVITDVSEECVAYIIRVTRIGRLGATLAVLMNRSMLWLLVTVRVVPSSPILISLIMKRYDPPKRRFLQESHVVTPQKTALFIVTVVKISNLATLHLPPKISLPGSEDSLSEHGVRYLLGSRNQNDSLHEATKYFSALRKGIWEMVSQTATPASEASHTASY